MACEDGVVRFTVPRQIGGRSCRGEGGGMERPLLALLQLSFNCCGSTRKKAEISNEALAVFGRCRFQDNSIVLGFGAGLGLLHYHNLYAPISFTHQISRLVTRIKECIRVKSIMVKKPSCVMKVNGMEGVQSPGTFCRSEFF